MTRAACVAIGWLLGLAMGLWMPGPPLPRLIAAPDLPDFAIAQPGANRIFLNLPALAQVPPPVANFFFLHEEGHIALRHPVLPAGRRRHQVELAADCWAAARATGPERYQAVRFFRRLGSVSFDASHPDGVARAAEVVRCSP